MRAKGLHNLSCCELYTFTTDTSSFSASATNWAGDLYWEFPNYDWNYGVLEPNRVHHISR
ncbi:hypothetical protein H6G61_05725 [Leptolyngbya sp. FACHB-238]|nr:hypothetical protein [Leptolyngbya sp. FACHB-238]